MTVMYSVGTSTYTKQHVLTVVAEDSQAYVIKPNGDRDEAMTKRLEFLASRFGTPERAEDWIRLFARNLSAVGLSMPTEVASVADVPTGGTE